MCKIYYKMVPEYFQNTMPNIRSKESVYVTRQSQNYNIPKSRLNINKFSLSPKPQMNGMLFLQKEDSLPHWVLLKNSLNTLKPTCPLYFSYGERYWNIIHTRLRHNCVLNIDLFRCNIIDSPLCSCGKPEDTYHYFFKL